MLAAIWIPVLAFAGSLSRAEVLVNAKSEPDRLHVCTPFRYALPNAEQ